jgi:predicted esterase
MKRLIFLLFLLSCSSNDIRTVPSPKEEAERTCFGATDAKHQIIWLHGLDSREPGDQEVLHRRQLEKIAEDFDVRFALPRGRESCGRGVCYGWEFKDDQVGRAIEEINRLRSKCFSKDAKPIIMGFSNGGYLINRLFRRCELKSIGVESAISIGASMLEGPLEAKPETLSSCGSLAFLIGKKDKYNFDPKYNLYRRLKNKNARVRLVEFDGEHELPDPALRAILRENF